MNKFRFTADLFNTGYPAQDQICADVANVALDEHLKELVRVWGLRCRLSGEDFFSNKKEWTNTHTALLWDLEETKPDKCLHSSLRTRHDGKLDCADCGKVLEYRLVKV